MSLELTLTLAFTGSFIVLFYIFFYPLSTLIVRYRAHYSPRTIFLRGDELNSASQQQAAGPRVRGLFHLASRVRLHEGYRGFYKGICPALLQMLIAVPTALLYSAIMGHPVFTVPPSHQIPNRGIWTGFTEFASALFGMVIQLPFEVIVNRAIATPYRLSYRPLSSLRLLLSPAELRTPYKLYCLPGLLISKLLHTAYLSVLLPLARNLLVPSLKPSHTNIIWVGRHEAIGLVAYGIFFVVSLAVVCALEVIGVRLSLQPLESSLVADSTAFTPLLGAEESVIQLRTPENSYGGSYTGALDCWQKISTEEGWRVLGRAWWLTALGVLGLSFSA